jgi:predicted Zn-dependent protease
MIDITRARELATAAVEQALGCGAEQSEVLVAASDSALTRFAGNRIHQNVASEDVEMQVRAVIGQQVGVASTNRFDEAGLASLCAAAVDAARHAPADPQFPGLPEGRPVRQDDRAAASTIGFDAEARARAAAALISPTAEAGGVAAGSVARRNDVVAIANSRGVDVAMPRTVLRSTILSTSAGGGTGWASYSGRDAALFDAASLGARAADISNRSSNPVELPPGDYTVLLAPEAVADLALFIAWYGGSAKTVEEGRSFMSGRIGQRVTSEAITLIDDAYSPMSIGLTFDYEGQPKERVALIDCGVASGPVTDSYWAAVTGRPNTGHALPPPNPQGPMPLDASV